MLYKKIEPFLNLSSYIKTFDDTLLNEKRENCFAGLNISIKAILLLRATKIKNGKILFITNSELTASDVCDDINILEEGSGVYFPDNDIMDYEARSPHYSITEKRIKALSKTFSSKNRVFCMTQKAFLRIITPQKHFKNLLFELKVDDEIEPNNLFKKLIECGYESEYLVSSVGQIAKRGDIIDIYLVGSNYPVRIDFYADIVESIRLFDPATQRSEKSLKRILVLPAKEFSLFDITVSSKVREKINIDGYYDGIENDISMFFGNKQCLFNYIKEPTIFFDNFDQISEYEKMLKQAWQIYNTLKKSDEYSPPNKIIQNRDFLKNRLKESFFFSNLIKDNIVALIESSFTEQLNMQNNINLLKSTLKSKLKQGYKIKILSDNASQSRRLQEVLSDLSQEIEYHIGVLSFGFDLPDAHLSVFTDHQILDRYKFHYKKFSKKEALTDFKSISPGDFIVHIDHGIGIFESLTKIQIDSSFVECLTLQYAKGDILYVPTYQLQLVSKFVAQEGVVAQVDTLGSKKWENRKAKVKKQIEEIAKDLLELYAKREVEKGIGFDKDTQWQKMLEDSFIFEDTQDQITATQNIKEDMEDPVPMERLLCGDVGFGKTEVAIRAAFKAVMSSFQVAILAPTTLLAEQLFLVFKQRLALYPIRVEMFSRFTPLKSIKVSLKDLELGGVDIAIGTHRLLSDDVKFKKLGLLVVDEEHRFGVRHKERLRKIKSNIDTLYMSATPIPRTLNMSLVGVKKISLLQTSPKARMPINTLITSYNKKLIKIAIQREIERNGQIFFLHNRIQNIQDIAQELQNLLPNIRLCVAHGQMKPSILEKIMIKFYHHEFDVLVTTTIIESGIDIPNANTIIINRADKFGLSQLYQLRGRVGRSARKAYCYLLIPKSISKVQDKRLSTLMQHRSLGSGYHIAMMDLQIRGMGNLLGTKQSGNIAAVGYNYYTHLLDSAVKKLKSKGKTPIWDSDFSPDIRIDGEYTIPVKYIVDERERLKIYHRMVDFKTISEFDDLEIELEDRFGKLSKETKKTINFFRIRFFCVKLQISVLKTFSTKLEITFRNYPKKTFMERLLKILNHPVSFDMTKGFVDSHTSFDSNCSYFCFGLFCFCTHPQTHLQRCSSCCNDWGVQPL